MNVTLTKPANLGQEEGHHALCAWPYRACVGFCAHLVNWQSYKFSSPLAERLHTLTLDSNQDAEVGEAETFGWFARFDRERAILSVDSHGFVGVSILGSPEDLESTWADLEKSYLWSLVDALYTADCDTLFLIIDTKRHIGSAPDLDEIREHIGQCEACSVNVGILD